MLIVIKSIKVNKYILWFCHNYTVSHDMATNMSDRFPDSMNSQGEYPITLSTRKAGGKHK